MTNDVRLCISGSRVGYVGEGIEDEDISVIVSGKYELVNGVHKVTYDEIMDDVNEVVNNTIYITDDSMKIEKEGFTNSVLKFSTKEQGVRTKYSTPYGDIFLRLSTHNLNVKREEDRIVVDVDYSLAFVSNILSTSKIQVDICSKDSASLEL